MDRSAARGVGTATTLASIVTLTCHYVSPAHASSLFFTSTSCQPHPPPTYTPKTNAAIAFIAPRHVYSSSSTDPTSYRYQQSSLKPFSHGLTHNGNDNRRHKVSVSSRRKDHDPSKENKNDKKVGQNAESNEDGSIGDGFINLNDAIDWESIDKMFDEAFEYTSINSLESPYDNPVEEPPSLEEIDSWMKKIHLQKKKQRRKMLWKKLFPWVSPLTSLILPKNYSSSPKASSSFVGRSRRYSLTPPLNPIAYIQTFMKRPNSARNLLVTLNVVFFLYQISTAVRYLPGFNRVLAMSVAGDALSAAALDGVVGADIPRWTPADVVLRASGLVGGGSGIVVSSGPVSGARRTFARTAGRRIIGMGRGPIAAHSMGPFFLDFAHQPYPLSHYQKHRYLTSGFLHGSLLHLGMNLRGLLSLPSWLENGIGKGVYLAAYLIAIVTGNIACTLTAIGDASGRATSSLCIGASGGICGLYGLMLATLLKMGNDDAAFYVLKQMVWLVAFGFLVPNVSNAGHVGGFLGGWLVGYLFGPGFERSYTLNRKDGFARDRADKEFRQMMGAGIYPNADKAFFSLKYLWMAIGVVILARPDLRLIPWAIWKGFLEPGSLSGVRTLLL